jgi:hypothetical protein
MGKQYLQAEVNNLPDDIEKYVVAKVCDGELWFWGTWDDKDEAEKAVNDVENGILLRRI